MEEDEENLDDSTNVRFERTYNLAGDLVYQKFEDGFKKEALTEDELKSSVPEYEFRSIVDGAQDVDISMNAGGGSAGGIDNIHVIYSDNSTADFSVATVVNDNGDNDRNFGIIFAVTSGSALMTKSTSNNTFSTGSMHSDTQFILPVLRQNFGVVCSGGTYKETIISINGDARATLIKIS